MKHFFSIVVSLIIFHNSVFGQSNDSVQHTNFDKLIYERIYTIEINDRQLLELVKSMDHSYEGVLINSVLKINRKGEPIKYIRQRLAIPGDDVEKIMNEVFKQGVESIPSCSEVEGCITGFDGTSISFHIKTTDVDREFSYWEPENDYYQNPDLKEIAQIRGLLKIIKMKIDLNYLFDQFIDSLPIGIYSYGGVLVTKR